MPLKGGEDLVLVTSQLNGELGGRHMVKIQLRKRWMPGFRVGKRGQRESIMRKEKNVI